MLSRKRETFPSVLSPGIEAMELTQLVLDTMELIEARTVLSNKDLEAIDKALRELRDSFFQLLQPDREYRVGPFSVAVREVTRPGCWTEAIAIQAFGRIRVLTINGRRI